MREDINKVLENVGKVIIGKKDVLDREDEAGKGPVSLAGRGFRQNPVHAGYAACGYHGYAYLQQGNGTV